jgi:hypothetical protein
MKELIIISILFSPLFEMAQESISVEDKFSIGVNFSPNFCYRMLNYPDELQTIADSREKFEHPSFGFNAGIAARYIFVTNLEVEFGVQFSRQTHIFKNVPISDAMGNPSLGFADNQLRYHYLELPLRVNYQFLNRKVFGYVTTGVSMNLFLNDKSKSWLTYNTGETAVVTSESSIYDFNKIAFAVLGGFGIGYHISEKLNVRLEPLFRYSLTPLAEAPINQYNYSIGCQFGVGMKL